MSEGAVGAGGPPAAIVVGSTFPVDPPRGGGQLRLLHICRALAELCPVHIVALAGDGEPRPPVSLSPNLFEERIPKTAAHVRAEAELQHEAGIPVTDIAFAELHPLTPAFSEAVRQAVRPGAAVLACHPYPLPALAAGAFDAPLLYDAQDVAVDLKASMLRPMAIAERLLQTTREVERACCEQAALVLPVSAQDGERLHQLYGLPAERVAVTPNGVDTSAIRFTGPAERRAIRSRLGLARPQALFLGSWHEPNLAAVRHVLHLAGQRPNIDFLVAGSACIPFRDTGLPSNVTMLGVVPDSLRDTVLRIADVGLNPMSSGSGSNIKMLDYLAAGVPVLCTQIGARGLDLAPEHARLARLPEFAAALDELLDEPLDALDLRVSAARRFVEERFDWSVIGARLRDRIGALAPAPAQQGSMAIKSPL